MASFNTGNSKLGKERSGSPEPSHLTTGMYVTMMETNEKECESWYYFIRRAGNEVALQKLQDQLETVRWRLVEDLSTFDLDLEHPVTAKTAKQQHTRIYFARSNK